MFFHWPPISGCKIVVSSPYHESIPGWSHSWRSCVWGIDEGSPSELGIYVNHYILRSHWEPVRMAFPALHVLSPNPFIVQGTQLVPTHIFSFFSLPPKRKPPGKMTPLPSSSSWCCCAWSCSCHLLPEKNNMRSNVSITQLQHSHPHPLLPLPWIILKQIPIIILFPTKIAVCIFKRLGKNWIQFYYRTSKKKKTHTKIIPFHCIPITLESFLGSQCI